MTFSFSTPRASPEACSEASSERPAHSYDLTVAIVGIVRINVIHPQSELKRVIISAERSRQSSGHHASRR